MAESIFARVSRLLSATVEDTVDRMEQAGGDGVMREAIREADRAIDQVKAELQSTMARRLPVIRLKSVDLPTFGRPTSTTIGDSRGIVRVVSSVT